jgi:hypothetical protein
VDKQQAIKWIFNRLTEKCTYSGASLVAISTLVLLGTPFIKLAAWLGIAYGAYSMVSTG